MSRENELFMQGPSQNFLPEPGISARLQQLNKSVNDATEKIIINIDSYRNVLNFARELYESYEVNMKNMLKVMKLLNDYAHFFNLLSESIHKLESNIIGINEEDVKFIEDMTTALTINFFNSAINETEKVKELFDNVGDIRDLSIGEERIKSLLDTAQSIKPVYIRNEGV